MKVNDVLADEMIELCVITWLPEALEIIPGSCAQILMARDVAYGRVQPHIKILFGIPRDLKAKIRCISRDVPILESSINPFSKFISNRRLQLLTRDPVRQECLKGAQLEK